MYKIQLIMGEVRAVLFDADGVLITPDKLFSIKYAEANGYDPEEFEVFFKGAFSEAIEGRADLKDLIRENNQIWRWEGDPQGLLENWFDSENIIDEELLNFAKSLKANGTPVYLATNQEKYRAKYLKEVMFPNVFDGFFISSEVGYMKRDPQFWAAALGKLAVDLPGVSPQEVVFFDDSQDSVDGAAEAGVRAYLYSGIDQVKSLLS